MPRDQSGAMLNGMNSMTDIPVTPPPPPPLPPPTRRTLRRSNNDRVAAGVAGGLGEYFGLDPVLFRVLFAVTSFFGGAGIIAYLLAWMVIPDQTTSTAPMDRIAATLRRFRVPFWLVAIIAIIVVWAGAFSWWAPGPSGAIVVAAVILAIVLSRRAGSKTGPPSAVLPNAVPAPVTPEPPITTDIPQPWLPETRSWIAESRARRRRSAPVRWATLGVLVAALGGIAIADAVGGIVLPVYFWVTGAIVLAGLLVGLALRRTPWTLAVLLIPAVLGLIAFGNTGASLHDGAGRTTVTPTAATQLDPQYRLAFGQVTLDLRSLASLTSPRTVDITLAGGEVHLLLPRTLNASVHAVVHAGDVRLNENRSNDNGGFNHTVDVPAATTATGAALAINVHLGAGDVHIDH
jgi:phage shock protein PspC (stress-responsive transcriptional regulator)